MRDRGPGFGRALGVLAAVSLLTGCVAGSTKDDGGSPRRDLAATPESLPPETANPTPTSVSGSASLPAGQTPTSPASGSASVSAPGANPTPTSVSGSPATTYRTTGTTTDPGADSGAPPYGDLVSVTIADGGANVRVTVTFAGDVPVRLPAGETMGVGVDLFRDAAQTESDYQLFADGEPDGWFAYLQTPKGFVRYPGTFGVGGRRLEFTVPWSSIGSPASGRFSAFADWTRDASPANQSGEDHAPNLGTASFTR
jgi:hypothetical protein